MKNLQDILTFAWRGNGKHLLFTCIIISIISNIAGLAPIIGSFAVLIITGYFCSLYYQLIQSSASGSEEALLYPQSSNFMEDIIWPMVQLFLIALISFAPFIVCSLLLDSKTISFLLGCLGIVYFPMAILAVVVLGYTGALSPTIVFPAILNAGNTYWLSVGILFILYSLLFLVEFVFSDIFILGNILISIIGCYVLITNARALGIVYRDRAEDLGWI